MKTFQVKLRGDIPMMKISADRQALEGRGMTVFYTKENGEERVVAKFHQDALISVVEESAIAGG